jgi:hypothetical protein
VDLAITHGVPVEESLAVRHPDAVTAAPGPRVLTAAALERWVQEGL